MIIPTFSVTNSRPNACLIFILFCVNFFFNFHFLCVVWDAGGFFVVAIGAKFKFDFFSVDSRERIIYHLGGVEEG